MGAGRLDVRGCKVALGGAVFGGVGITVGEGSRRLAQVASAGAVLSGGRPSPLLLLLVGAGVGDGSENVEGQVEWVADQPP
ncbi:hypothetical protein [Streptomyces sp. NPDC048272]|uniref:hypothetical protein n=1 Tax=Streptomyces sp. NPDC048272 TaxID=3154616 RepID=UPI00344AEEF1